VAKQKPARSEGTIQRSSRVEQVVRWLEKEPEKLIDMLPEYVGKEGKARFLRICMGEIRRNPGVAQCTPVSIFSAITTAAAMGLEPGVPGQGYLVGFGTECQFIPGYQGLCHLVIKSGKVSDVNAEVVRQNDDTTADEGNFKHHFQPFASRADRGPMVGVYARFIIPNAPVKTVMMSREQVEEVKAKSRSARGSSGPWNGTETDQEEMWKKTVIIRGCKTLPLTRETKEAIERLEVQDGTIIEGRAQPLHPSLKDKLRARSSYPGDSDSGGDPGGMVAPAPEHATEHAPKTELA